MIFNNLFITRRKRKQKIKEIGEKISRLDKELEAIKKLHVSVYRDDEYDQAEVSLGDLALLAKKHFPGVRLEDIIVNQGSAYEAWGYGYGAGSSWFYLMTRKNFEREKELEKSIDTAVDEKLAA